MTNQQAETRNAGTQTVYAAPTAPGRDCRRVHPTADPMPSAMTSIISTTCRSGCRTPGHSRSNPALQMPGDIPPFHLLAVAGFVLGDELGRCLRGGLT